METPSIEYLRQSGHLFGPHIKKKFPEYYEYLTEKYDMPFTEALYNDLISSPNNCKQCGKPTKFINFNKGYHEFCCPRCQGIFNSSKTLKTRYLHHTKQDIANKSKQTCLKRYGTEHYTNHEKARQTCLERYGIENPAQSRQAKDKSKQTCLKRYGTEHYTNHEKARQTCLERYGGLGMGSILREKIERTNIDKYGCKTPFENIDIQIKAQQSIKDISIEKCGIIKFADDGTWICKCPHPECNKCTEKQFNITPQLYHCRASHDIEVCTNLHPIQSQISSIELDVRRILDEYHIEYEINNRIILDGKELDIYIPSKKIAIECNGCFWHQTNPNISHSKPKQYHISKFKKCAEQGIQLITIWDDWMINKPHIVRSILRSKFGIYKSSIYARKCVIREINNKICNDFLDQYHIQGRCSSSIRYGLFYNDRLISVMTFGKRTGILNRHKQDQWELIRYCCESDVKVIGGASKMLKYFIKQYNPDSIVSFSSNDISIGKLYSILGFSRAKKIQQSYWYVGQKNFKRYHRSSFTKQSIKRKWPDEIGTEQEIMYRKSFWCIYDSGTIRWELKNLSAPPVTR